MMKLTKPQHDELARRAHGPQPTFGRWRTRVQNSLRGKGLARFLVDGKPHQPSVVEIMVSAGYGSWADSCEITPAGLAALAAHEEATKKPKRRAGMRGLGVELAELERTNPEVGAAAENYDRVRDGILADARRKNHG